MSSEPGHSNWYRYSLRILIGGLIATAILGAVGFIVAPMVGRGIEYVIVSLLTVALFSLTSMACVLNWTKGSWCPAAAVGLVLSVLSLPLFLVGIWNAVPRGYERMAESAIGLGATWSILLPLLGLLGLARLHKRWLWTRVGAQLLATVTALFITWLILANPRSDDWLRVMGVLLLLTGCGAMCTLVLHWINVLQTPANVITTPLALTLICPRCGQTQELAAGRSRCAKCGLKFRIEIEEEHCPKCGYSLYKLTSAQCPECGTPVLGLVERPGEQRESAETTHAG